MSSNVLRAGLDVGSTTLKVVLIDGEGKAIFTRYSRHNTDIPGTLNAVFGELSDLYPLSTFRLAATGSAGMGIAARCGLPFIQEVVAACKVVATHYPEAAALVDIGGEDAKMIFFAPGRAPDMRMNGSCAGGTGAFIDQMAALLNVKVEQLGPMAQRATKVHPIASRCGVFSKTDIQNLLARNARRDDIAASIFHAVSIQVLTTLSRGYTLRPKVLLCGGPFAYIPYLREAFAQVSGLQPGDFALPDNPQAIPAWGAALSVSDDVKALSASQLQGLFSSHNTPIAVNTRRGLRPLFDDAAQYVRWVESKADYRLPADSLASAANGPCYLGVDSGSTTTKVILLNSGGKIIYRAYRKNGGVPLEALATCLGELVQACVQLGLSPTIGGACVTGYGEDLIRKAFGFDDGMVETLAHYKAAAHFEPRVSFILDIGGQDMKAAFVHNATITRLEINEACSSGCGSFIETFASSLGYQVADFACAACSSQAPCDLGTRCTVFMNSRVKQSLREGATHADISAGLGYSVIRNSLNKVLKIKDFSELGDHVMVQGGTFRNPAVCRAFELETGKRVIITDAPELMGAFGAALYARDNAATKGYKLRPLAEIAQPAEATTRQSLCKGCHNQCEVTIFTFANGERYFAGNKCEKVFTNRGHQQLSGANASEWKYNRLFAPLDGRQQPSSASKPPRGVIGLPRVLGMYESFPFWQALFAGCGYEIRLSPESTIPLAERGAHTVMSDNICFPAKLAHGHLMALAESGVDRIFMPFIVYAPGGNPGANNTYNCPVVSGYSEVLRSAISPHELHDIPIDAPTISFRDSALLHRQCWRYFKELSSSGLRLSHQAFNRAFTDATSAQQRFENDVQAENRRIADAALQEGRTLIMLAGRPYHADPLIQHKVSQIIASFGVDVVTEDLVRDEPLEPHLSDSVHQWAFANRVIAAARWAASAGPRVHYVQLSSFGCGPDAYIVDEAIQALARYGKTTTMLKVDDVNNPGSLKLRIRSLIESIRLQSTESQITTPQPHVLQKPFEEKDRNRTILMPWFGDAYSPYLPPLFQLAGYHAVNIEPAGEADIHLGLRHSNNEICYPATLIVGYFMRAMASGRYDPQKVAFGLTQTGGQCRATNYVAMVKHALQEIGLGDVPIISVAVGQSGINEQPGFNIPVKKMLLPTLRTLIYADIMSTMLLAARPRERRKGIAQEIFHEYTQWAIEALQQDNSKALYTLLENAARAFTDAINPCILPRVGVVGEIFVKYNSQANRGLVDWLIGEGIEPVVPALAEFFFEGLASQRVRVRDAVDRQSTTVHLLPIIERLLFGTVRRMERLVRVFPYYRPIGRPLREAQLAAPIINLNAQFGEGWLIPASFARFASEGINSVVCLQPFGCIANHIVAKGIEKRTRDLYPNMSLLFLDLDSGVSDANFFNRLHFLSENARANMEHLELAHP